MPKKYIPHKKPSEKQVKFLALLEQNPDMSPAEAGRAVGYSENTIHNIRANVLNRPMVKTILDNYRYQLEQHNINPQRLASKLDALLDAKDAVTGAYGVLKDSEGNTVYKEDRKSQLQAIKLLHEVYEIGKAEGKNDGVTKRITLEEFEEKEHIIE